MNTTSMVVTSLCATNVPNLAYFYLTKIIEIVEMWFKGKNCGRVFFLLFFVVFLIWRLINQTW